MKFAIGIPNFNYANYLPRTLKSVLDQYGADMEVLVSDNCSTDNSVAVIKEFQQTNHIIQLKTNPFNVGFAGNLDRVSTMATADFMIMLSSDDIIKKDALKRYVTLLEIVGTDDPLMITAAKDIIDSSDNILRTELAADMSPRLWAATDIDKELSHRMGVNVFKVKGDVMMERVLRTWGNPFNFLATCYTRKLYEKVGGYGIGRMINPDKWFHWRLLGEVGYVYFIDEPLFQYRWHATNQTAQEVSSGHLKYLSDEYRTIIELPDKYLGKASLTRKEVNELFVQNIIYKHGLGELYRGLILKSFRVFCFGWATFPKIMVRSVKSYLYLVLLMLGPIGGWLLRLIKRK